MRILVIGSGGREHALCYALAKSPLLAKLYIAPGNAGTSKIATNIALDINNNQAICDFCQTHEIDLVVIGPEGPLVNGLVDALQAINIRAFGPSKAAAELEASKDFTKKLCIENNIPTAAYQSFTDKEAALKYLDTQAMPIVLKADGLAAGKGVIIAEDLPAAKDALDEIFSGKFGKAGEIVVIEEFLTGTETSFFALCDGQTAKFFCSAQDHKRAFDNDQGPNTGGMGAFAPSALITDELKQQVMAQIIEPTLQAMKKRGTPFTGVLFAGLMLTKEGPKLLEYNVRFGDPETEAMLTLLDCDLVSLLLACATGDLASQPIHFKNEYAVCVIMAAKGYPGDYQKGSVIKGLDNICSSDNVNIFHAGTILNSSGQLLANGGRVLAVTAHAASKSIARELAYETVHKINWPEGFYRNDIAADGRK